MLRASRNNEQRQHDDDDDEAAPRPPTVSSRSIITMYKFLIPGASLPRGNNHTNRISILSIGARKKLRGMPYPPPVPHSAVMNTKRRRRRRDGRRWRARSNTLLSAAITSSPSLSVVAVVAALLLVVVALHSTPANADFNFEVGLRVTERVTEFMSAPPEALELISTSRINGHFPNDLTAPDRDAFLTLGDALMRTYGAKYKFDMVYYGLEDGTFVGTYYPKREATYREPGESGYTAVAVVADVADDDGADMDDDDDNADDARKHYATCVDGSGYEVPCRLAYGGSYIECVDGCSLADCPRDADTGGGEEVESAQTLQCAQYAERTFSPEDQAVALDGSPGTTTTELGYIPRSYYCVDDRGLPSQEPGTVSKDPSRDAEPGSCYYPDGVTLVDRHVEGEFAYCGGEDKSCNTTFVGAYRGINYDPRYRGWYKTTKRLMTRNWSKPYLFFTTGQMGITYNHPIFAVDEGTGREALFGVLAMDLSLNNIAEFLIANYRESDTVVTIVEGDAPYNVIASSTGSTGARRVLEEDETRPCPPDAESRDVACKVVRIPVAELPDASSNDLDGAIAASFARQAAEGFPESRLVSVEHGGQSYVSETILFVPGGGRGAGIEWRIMIMSPMEEDPDDTVNRGDSAFAFVLIAASIGFVLNLVLLYLHLKNRNEREVICGDWRFTGLFILACAVLNLSCLSFLGDNTDELCLLRMWLVHLCFVLALAPLLVKTIRMYLLVGQEGFNRQAISHKKTALMMVPFISIEVVILLIFTFVDPNAEQTVIIEEGYDVFYRRICSHDTNAFFIVQIIYEGGLVLIGCFMAYKTRNMSEEFGEAKQLILTMYNIALVGTAILIATNVVDSSLSEVRVIIAVGVVWTTCFSSCVFVLPRLLKVENRLRSIRNTSRRRSSTISSNRTLPRRGTQIESRRASDESSSNGLRRASDDSSGSELGPFTGQTRSTVRWSIPKDDKGIDAAADAANCEPEGGKPAVESQRTIGTADEEGESSGSSGPAVPVMVNTAGGVNECNSESDGATDTGQ